MTLIEAIKSGRPFKRKNWEPIWLTPGFCLLRQFLESDAIADDWITEASPREFWVSVRPNGSIHIAKERILGDSFLVREVFND